MVGRLLFVVVLAVSACSDDGSAPSTTAPAPPATTAAPVTAAAPATTTAAPATTAAPPTTPPSPAAEVTVAPFAPLAGVPLDTEAETAVTELTAALGAPDEDTGLIEGCPLDGAGANERYLSWGGLTAQFRLDEAGAARFSAWTYAPAAGTAPVPVVLPGGLAFGDPLAAVAAELGAEVTYDDVFDVATTGVDGLAVWGDPGVQDGGIAFVGVPFVPTCD